MPLIFIISSQFDYSVECYFVFEINLNYFNFRFYHLLIIKEYMPKLVNNLNLGKLGLCSNHLEL